MTSVHGAPPCQPDKSEDNDSSDGVEPFAVRPSRIAVEALVTLNGDSGIVEATACDVSQNGLKIALDGPLAKGPITVKLAGFPIFTGQVRWRGARHIGIEFLRPISWESLTTWVKVHGLGRRS